MKEVKALAAIKYFTFLALIFSVLVSCKDSSSNTDMFTGEFNYMESTYDLSFGVVTKGGEINNFDIKSGFRWHVISVFESYNTNPSNTQVSEYGIYFSFGILNEIQTLDEGTYTYGDPWGSEENHVFSVTFFDNLEDTREYATTGSITVLKDENTYSIDFSFTMNNGEQLTGSASGEFEILNNSE